MTRVLTRSILPFLLTAFAIIISSWYIINSKAFSEMPDLMAFASTIDLTLLIPVAYFFFIRKTKIPKITIVPVFVLSMVLAGQLIPESHQQTLDYVRIAIPLVELFVIGMIVYSVRKTFKAYKRSKAPRKGFVETVHEATEKAYGQSTLANVLATEISLFHYSLLGWGPQIEAPKNSRFSYHKDSGYYAFFGVAIFALIAETTILHILLVAWSATAAWILTGLSIYSLFFVFGDFNAIRKRPIYFGEEHLELRIGLRWRMSIPYSQVSMVELRVPDKEKEEFANLIVAGEANTVIDFKSEMTAKGLYGLKKTFTRLALNMDDKQEFMRQLQEKIT